MKTILFPTQFSEQAQSKLTSACRLAHQNGARIIVLAIIPTPDPYIHPTANLLNHTLEEGYMRYAKAFINLKNRLAEKFSSKLQIELDIVVGNAFNSVLLAAEKYNPNVVLMGGETYGRVTKLTEKLIQKLACPVLALPENVQLEASPRLVYATNFRKEDRRVIDKLIRFTEDFSGSLHCIHIKQDQSVIDYSKVLPWQQLYQQEIEKGLVSFEVIYQEEVHEQLDTAWARHKPGLWVLPMAKNNWVQKLFPSSSPSLDVSPFGSPILALSRR
jgi:nucleotide-binding universal stress UspA family protein